MIILVTAFLTGSSGIVAADTNNTNMLQNLDIVDFIVFWASILAIALGVVSFFAYRRDGRTKFLLVTIAFSIFALKGVFLIAGDLIIVEQIFLDVIANLLDFAVLICFFLAFMMK
jgi:hypothetical protein